MTREVATIENGMSFEQMKERAALLVKSGFLPVAIKTPEQALTIMLTGQELGLGFMEALRSINVIQGKPCMAAQLLLGLCYRTKEVEQAFFEKKTAEECIYVLKRKGNPAERVVWNMGHAKAMGLADRDNWKKQPQTMLEWRAISKAARLVFPDAICGLYTPEEIAEGVDLVDTPTGPQVERVIEKAPDKTLEEATAAATEALPPSEGAAGLVNPMEVDRLGMTYLKAPYDKIYTDKCIMEIYGTMTPGGKPKGKPFLEMVAQHSKDAEERAIVAKFLELMAIEA